MRSLFATLLLFASAPACVDAGPTPDTGTTQCVAGTEPQSYPDFSPCIFSAIDRASFFVPDEGFVLDAEVSTATFGALDSDVFEADVLGFCSIEQFNRSCGEDGTAIRLELDRGPLFLCFPTTLDIDVEQLVEPFRVKIRDTGFAAKIDVKLTRSEEPILITSSDGSLSWARETRTLVSPYFEIDSNPESHCRQVDCGNLRDLNYRLTAAGTTTDIASGETLRIEDKVFQAGSHRSRTEWSCTDGFGEASWIFYAANPE